MNLGIAAATPRGLVVPNIKDAQDLSLIELAEAIQQLTETARLGRTQPAEMQHGTITITNFGVFGMDFGTPILNRDEVAILAMGSIKQKPWVVDGEVRPRFVTTVSGSFDHRVIDGALAELQAVLAAFRQAGVTAVLVTNELGCGIVPMEHVSRLYRDLMGKINQAAAAEADEVYLSVCGITTELKHQAVCLPEVKS